MVRRWPICSCLAVVAICWPRLAAAYRPFDGTDADVAGQGEVELEVGPAGYHQEGTSQLIFAPALVVNYGFARNFEAVLEGRQSLQQSPAPHVWRVQDVAFSIKSLLRRGSLQGRAGLSVALEAGMLLPSFESAWGTHLGSIFSLQLPALTLHLNLANNISYSVRYEASASIIAEGPNNWCLRPVAEVLGARDFGESGLYGGVAGSVLVGGILRATDALSFDLAGRYGRAGGQHEEEVRAGLTWGFEPW